MVNDIGLRWKSGQLFPSGMSTTNCVIITPGILDFFLIPAAESQHRRYQLKRAGRVQYILMPVDVSHATSVVVVVHCQYLEDVMDETTRGYGDDEYSKGHNIRVEKYNRNLIF